MFDAETFLVRLKKQSEESNVQLIEAWEVAQGIFAASIREKNRILDWPTTVFYFKKGESKIRDKNSYEQLIDRRVQLMMAMGFKVGKLSEDSEDLVRAAYFEKDNPVGNNPKNLVNFASQLFAKQDNSEIDWPATANPIDISEL